MLVQMYDRVESSQVHGLLGQLRISHINSGQLISTTRDISLRSATSLMAPSIRTPPPGQPGAAQRQIPGPAGLPWIGQLPAFLRSKFFPKQMLAWAEEFKGVYQLEIVGKKYLVVTDPTLMPPIVGRGTQGLPKSEGYGMWDPVISPHPGVQGLFTVPDNNATWRTIRRAYGPAMGPGTMGHHYPIVMRCAVKLGDYMEAAGSRGGTSLELNSLLKSLTLDMLGLSAFDVDFRCLDNPRNGPLPHNLERSMLECGERGRSVGRRLLPWLFEEERREGEAAMAAIHAVAESVWQDIKARGPPADDDTSMGAQFLRLASPPAGSAAVSEDQIRAEIATVVLAGYETTANTLTWMLFGLYAHPEAAAKVEQELKLAGLILPADTSTSSAPGSDPVADAFLALPGGHEALSSLPYLDAYVRECLRMYSTAPNGLIKAVPRDGPPARIGPYEAPPGSTVWVPFWSLHLSELNWERPLEFELERWVGQDPRASRTRGSSRCPVATAVGAIRVATGQAGSDVSGSDSDSGGEGANAAPSGTASGARGAKEIRYMPFGDGSRNCVGQHLATLQLKVALAYIASRFRLRLDEREMGGVAGALDRQRVNLTLEVDGGMWMFAEPRQ